MEYQPEKQQQQQRAAEVNYVQTFPSLQAAYPNKETGQYYSLPERSTTVNINTFSTACSKDEGGEEKKEAATADQKSETT